VLLRLVLPVSLPSEASFFNAVGRMVSVTAGDSGTTMTNSILAVDGYFPMRFKTPALAAAFHWAGTAWLIGALVAAAALAALYGVTAWRFRTAARVDAGIMDECAAAVGLRRRVPLVASGAVSSPVVFGILRPRVVIPVAMAGDVETLRYALLHECVHIRRGDNVWRVLAALALCAHWFNPLVWLCLTLSGGDMELACDAGVLKKLDASQRKAYALALAGLAAQRQPLLSAAFGSSAVKRRITGIVRYKRLTLVEILLSVLLLLVLAIMLASNPAV
jgi:beta-lactamase regulating signal transducer with metallopeptidase domain